MNFVKQTLPEHCRTLDIPLEIVSLKKDENGWWVNDQVFKRPEPAALQLFINEGWNGTHVEGAPILIAMKAAGLDWLVQHNTFNDRQDAIRRYLEASVYMNIKKSDGFIACVEGCNEKKFNANFVEIYADSFIQDWFPTLTSAGMLTLFRALGPKLTEISRIFASRPYDLRAGWPDLCLIKGDNVQFVEVKTTDNVHASQYDVISSILKPLSLPVKVLKLTRQR